MDYENYPRRHRGRRRRGVYGGKVLLLLGLFLLAAALALPVLQRGLTSPVYRLSDERDLQRVLEVGSQAGAARRAGLCYVVEQELGTPNATAADFQRSDKAAGLVVTGGLPAEQPLGLYPVSIALEGKDYLCYLLVKDTQAPTVGMEPQIIPIGTVLTPSDFVAVLQDASPCEAGFLQTPDWTQGGTQAVKLLVADAAGNESRVETELTIYTDLQPPVISGAAEQTVYVGSKVSYREGVTAVDAEDGAVALSVDAAAVNITLAGSYPVTYSAQDSWGNQAELTVNLIVANPPNHEPTPHVGIDLSGYVLADEVEKIYAQVSRKGAITDPQTLARAIYEWSNNTIAYTGTSDKSSWQTAALEGLVTRKGDCYTYFAVGKALLERAGIANLDVVKIYQEGRAMHYWSLVDVGQGWYHFDSCPRKHAPDFFLWTDQQMLDFSAAHQDCFDFDQTLYPPTPEEPTAASLADLAALQGQSAAS